MQVALSELSGFKRTRRRRRKKRKNEEEESRGGGGEGRGIKKVAYEIWRESGRGGGEIAGIVDLMKMNHTHMKLPNNKKKNNFNLAF